MLKQKLVTVCYQFLKSILNFLNSFDLLSDMSTARPVLSNIENHCRKVYYTRGVKE
jgi:hypothetical protein